MDSATLSNAASAEEGASVAAELKAQSRDLQEAVSELQRLLEGKETKNSGKNEPPDLQPHRPAGKVSHRSRPALTAISRA